jgi:hypothetical protein
MQSRAPVGTRWLVGIKHGDIAAIGSVVTAGVPRFPGACHQIKDRAGGELNTCELVGWHFICCEAACK